MRAVRLLLAANAARWKNKRNIGVMLVLIIVMISTFCYVRIQKPEQTENSKIALGVACEDTSEYAKLLLQYFRDSEAFRSYVELVEDKEQKLQEALLEGNLDALLVIPEHFAQSMIQMENLPIRARVSGRYPTKALILRHVMEAYETYIEAVEVNCTALYRRMKEEGFSEQQREAANVDISMDLIFTALGKDDFFRKRTIEPENVKTVSLLEHYQYTLVYFVLLFVYIPAGLQVIALKKNGLARRFQTMNISWCSIVTAIAIPGAVCSVLLVNGVLFLKGVWEPGKSGKALLLVLPWLLVALFLGKLCKDDKQYLFVCCMLLTGLAVLGGSLIPEEFLPDGFRLLAEWMPNRNFTHVMGGVR